MCDIVLFAQAQASYVAGLPVPLPLPPGPPVRLDLVSLVSYRPLALISLAFASRLAIALNLEPPGVYHIAVNASKFSDSETRRAHPQGHTEAT